MVYSFGVVVYEWEDKAAEIIPLNFVNVDTWKASNKISYQYFSSMIYIANICASMYAHNIATKLFIAYH